MKKKQPKDEAPPVFICNERFNGFSLCIKANHVYQRPQVDSSISKLLGSELCGSLKEFLLGEGARLACNPQGHCLAGLKCTAQIVVGHGIVVVKLDGFLIEFLLGEGTRLVSNLQGHCLAGLKFIAQIVVGLGIVVVPRWLSDRVPSW